MLVDLVGLGVARILVDSALPIPSARFASFSCALPGSGRPLPTGSRELHPLGP